MAGFALSTEAIEARLLLEQIRCGRVGGLLFQGEMHALVAAVLLGMARANALNADA
jgi:hypothetical protein